MARVRNLLEAARREYRRSHRAASPDEGLLLRRQAAEKAWGYVLEQVDRQLRVRARDDTAHDERREKLRVIEERSGTPLLATYYELQNELHGNCFYRGSCPRERVERLLAAAASFPGLVEEAVRRASRGR